MYVATVLGVLFYGFTPSQLQSLFLMDVTCMPLESQLLNKQTVAS